MNMSIKACAPHPSCQLPKVPSISAPRAAESLPMPGAGVPVTAAPAPRSSEQGSVPATCKRGHPGTGSHSPSWLWQPPASVQGHQQGSPSLPTLPQCPGFGQTHHLCSARPCVGVWAGLVWAQPFPCPQHKASRSWGRRVPPLSCCPTHPSQHGISASAGQGCLGRAVPVK